MKQLLICLFILISTITAISQDIIIRKSGERIECKITSVDSLKIYFDLNTNGRKINTFINLDQLQTYQYNSTDLSINKYKIYGPGDELIKYSSHFYTGLVLFSSGYAISIFGAGSQNKNVMLIGGLFAIVGTVFEIESHSHIGKAGRLMKQQNGQSNRVKIGSTSEGFGITCSLSR
jgi:hypothetical protein